MPPAAVNMIAATMSAREFSSLTVSTLVAVEASTTSLSNEAAAAETIWVIPIDAYCDADSETLLFEPLPSAPIKMAAQTPDIATGLEATPVLPAASVAVAVKLCTPAESAGDTTNVQLPLESATAVPSSVIPS